MEVGARDTEGCVPRYRDGFNIKFIIPATTGEDVDGEWNKGRRCGQSVVGHDAVVSRQVEHQSVDDVLCVSESWNGRAWKGRIESAVHGAGGAQHV